MAEEFFKNILTLLPFIPILYCPIIVFFAVGKQEKNKVKLD